MLFCAVGMKQGEIQQMLAATNRWWRDLDGWAREDPDLREASAAPFDYSADALDDLAPGGLYVLRGPRRVGKSVELKRTIERLLRPERGPAADPRRVLHASVDGWRAADLGRLVAAAGQLTPAGHRHWFIDEITGIADGWPDRIKWLRDNDQRFRQDTVVLTGSSAAGLTGAVKALAGRRGPAVAPDRFLLPMGFRSFAERIEPPAEGPIPNVGRLSIADLAPPRLADAALAMAPWLDWLVSAWQTYLHVGGFPAVLAGYLRERVVPPQFLRSLLDVVHGDAFRRADWSRPQTTALLRRIAQGLCSPVNQTAIAEDLALAQPTVLRRIEELRDAFVLWPCHRELRLRPKLNARAKVYFLDPAYAALGASPPDDSQLAEQQLGVALLRCCERMRPGSYLDFADVLHHRSNTRREIDFVGPSFGGVAVESKFVDGRWKRDAQTLAASKWRGIVATRSELDLNGSSNAVAIPAALLAWLVDD